MVRRFDYRLDVIRNGVKYDTLQCVGSPSLMGDSGGDIESSMSAVVLPHDRIDLLHDYIRPVAIINGIEHRLGEYCVARLDKSTDSAGAQTWNIEAYDKSWILEQTKIETVYSLAESVNCVSAVNSLLVDAGIALYRSIPSSLTLPYAMEWQAGTSYLQIINDLLAIINYDKLFFDFNGYAVVQPYTAPTADNIDHTLNGNTEISVIATENTQTMDIFNAPNVFIVTCAAPDSSEILTATAINNSPLSELSVLKRGRRIATVINVDNIADQDTLQAYAEKVRNDSLFTSEEITITTVILPDYAVNQIIAVNHPDISGIFQEKSWEINLSTDGQMTHRLQRLVLA